MRTSQPIVEGNRGEPEALLLDPEDAATALAISARTLWEWTRRGRIPAIKLGRLVRYDLAALREWLRRESKTKKDGQCNGIDQPGKERAQDNSIRG